MPPLLLDDGVKVLADLRGSKIEGLVCVCVCVGPTNSGVVRRWGALLALTLAETLAESTGKRRLSDQGRGQGRQAGVARWGQGKQGAGLSK